MIAALWPPSTKRDPFVEVATVEQGVDELGTLGGIGRSVGVEHHDDAPGCGREPAGQRIALVPAALKEQRMSGRIARATAIVSSSE